jgi:peptidoglycan hydrolase CwlO-like protein
VKKMLEEKNKQLAELEKEHQSHQNQITLLNNDCLEKYVKIIQLEIQLLEEECTLLKEENKMLKEEIKNMHAKIGAVEVE